MQLTSTLLAALTLISAATAGCTKFRLPLFKGKGMVRGTHPHLGHPHLPPYNTTTV
jgi:outer membrane protein assembly factor BamE (lipoprotein component of BamABCDE complex)